MGQHDRHDRPVVHARHAEEENRCEKRHRHQHREDAEQTPERKAGPILPATLADGRDHTHNYQSREADRLTDPAGVATVTLTESGWWAVTAVRDAGVRQRGGKSVPVKQRTTLWVHVDDKVPLTPAK